MSGREENYQQAMQEGHTAAWEEQWERAAEFYRQALIEFPHRPEALTSLGLALIGLAQYEEALKCYLKAAEASPEDPIPLEKAAEIYEKMDKLKLASKYSFQAGQLYLNRREIQKAIENFSRTTRCDPDHLAAHSRLATLFERLGHKQHTVAEYLSIARLMQQAGDFEKALKAVEHALKILPDSQEAQHALALLKEFKPLPKPTTEKPNVRVLPQPHPSALPEEIEPSPSPMNPVAEARQKALEALANFLLEFEKEPTDQPKTPRKGLQALVHGVASNLFAKQPEQERIAYHLTRSIDFDGRGEFNRAAQELEQALSQGLDHPAAYFLLGHNLIEEGQINEALKALRQISDHPDYSLAANLLIGQSLMKSGQMDEATNFCLTALKLADSTTVPTKYVSALQKTYDNLIKAKAYALDSETQKRLCENVSNLLTRPDWRRHLSQTRKDLLVEHTQESPKPLVELIVEASNSRVIEAIGHIQQLARNGKVRSAIEEAFYAIQFAPSYLPIHLLIGELLFQQGHIAEAVEKFTVVARAYHSRGDAQSAIDLLDRVKKLAPMDRAARNLLIEELIISGNEKQAVAEYLELAEVNYNLADLEQARKCYTEALRLANKVGADLTSRLQILYHIADIDLQNLDWRKALRVFEEIRNLQPEDGQAWAKIIEMNFRLSHSAQAMTELENYLSLLLGKDKAESALKFLQTLIQEMPEQLALQRRLASLYVQRGNIHKAVEQLDQIGRKLLQVGDHAGASEIVEAIIALNPPNKVEYQKFLMRLRGQKA